VINMIIKRFLFITILLLSLAISCASRGKAVETITLDKTIQEAARQIENRLEEGVKIALLNFSSPSDKFSEYVLEELSACLVNGGKLVVVERKELDIIRQEEKFQFSGEVSDETAQSIGKKLGAQVIVSGSLSDIGKNYRFRIKTLVVETAAIAATFSVDINATEERVVSLLAGAKPAVEQVTVIEEDPLPEGLLYEVINRTITITKYIGNEADLRIPVSIQGMPVTVIGEYAFSHMSRLEIGENAFAHRGRLENGPPAVLYERNYSLKNVTIPSSVTTIGNYAFDGCSSLTNITIPSSVTTIGVRAFSGCSSLTNINVDPRNSMYTSVGGVLFNRSGRTLIRYPENKSGTYTIPSSVTTIGDSAFFSCKFTYVDIPSSVITIGNDAFHGCNNLTSVYIPPLVTTIGNFAFSYCSSLTNVTIPSLVTTIGKGAFSECSSLKSVTIHSSVTTIEDIAFFHCSSLTSVTIPSSVTTIGDSAFAWCFSLTKVDIPSLVTTIGREAFSGCSSLTSVTLSRKTKLGYNAFPSNVKIQYID